MKEKKYTATELFGILVSELAHWHHGEKEQKLLDLYNEIWYDEDLTVDDVDWEN